MSNLLDPAAGDARCVPNPCEAVELAIEPTVKDLGGFSVRRLLPARERTMVGPFIFFDHFGPTRFDPGNGMDVRPHPHINLATVTYLFDGEVLHRDSLGNVQTIRPGEINWMTAGRGIVHSERTPPELRAGGPRLHGLQLWVALPEADEETAPSFQHYEAGDLPSLGTGGASVRVLVGAAFGLRSAVAACSPTLYVEARLEAGAVWRLPDEAVERGVYLVSGALRARDYPIRAHTLVTFAPGAEVSVTAEEASRLVLVGGEPLGKRRIWWNYVSSRPERIERAKEDWANGRFPPVPGETEFIPLPGST